jgi:hypothetical protein
LEFARLGILRWWIDLIKAVSLDEAQMKCRIVLDLGDVRTSAEVFVNSKLVDTQLARPFLFDVTQREAGQE